MYRWAHNPDVFSSLQLFLFFGPPCVMCINIYVCIYSLAAVLLGFIDYCRLVTDNMWKKHLFFFNILLTPVYQISNSC